MTRERVLAHADYKRGICGCGCGQPITESIGKPQPWFVDSFVCQAGRALAAREREARDQAKDMNKPEGWDDGLHYYVRPVEPDDLKPKPKGADRAAPTRNRKRRL